MTQNKFWLVWNEAGNAPKKPHDTQEKAITEAKNLTSRYPQHTYIVLEATHIFKADVNVVENFFDATPTDVGHKFKIGDEVLYSDFDKNGIASWENGVIINIIDNEYFKIENKLTNKMVTYELNGKYFKLSETSKREFKVGDNVLLDNSFECVIDDYIFETQHYKISFMRGGYKIVNESRLSRCK
jgi:hypothetical protein